MVPKGKSPTTPTKSLCPSTGKPSVMNARNGRLQPETPYTSDENPAGLNERIRARGYNPDAYMLQEGVTVATVYAAHDRGKFGGWQVQPLDPERIGMLTRWTMPESYASEWFVSLTSDWPVRVAAIAGTQAQTAGQSGRPTRKGGRARHNCGVADESKGSRKTCALLTWFEPTAGSRLRMRSHKKVPYTNIGLAAKCR